MAIYSLLIDVRVIGPFVMGWGISRRKVYDLCLALTRQALRADQCSDPKLVGVRIHLLYRFPWLIHHFQQTMIQWTVEATRIREATEVAKMALGLVFASAFQVPIPFPATRGLRGTRVPPHNNFN